MAVVKNEAKQNLTGRNASYRLRDNKIGQRFMLKLINVITKHMMEHDIKFSHLAKKLGITRASVSIMFTGRVVWSFMTFINVCDALDLDFQVVLTPRSVKL